MMRLKISAHHRLFSDVCVRERDCINIGVQGPVVQSIVSLTSSLRGQLVKCFTTL